MKTLKNTIAVVAIATLLFSSNLFAQMSNSADAQISISIFQGLSITNNGTTIAFPKTLQNEGATLNPNVTGEGAKFTIGGTPARSVSLTFATTIALTSALGADLDFTTNLVANNTDDATTAIGPSGSVVLNSSGKSFVYVGGSVSPDDTHDGDYTGTFTLDIAYN